VRRRLALTLSVLLVTGLVPLAVANALGSGPHRASAKHHKHYSVTITRTEEGIPHIVGANYGDVGYGFGYAFAQDNICVMADDYITVEGKRAQYFGPNGSYYQGGNGVTVNNLDSDFFWKGVAQSHIVRTLLARKPPIGPMPGIKSAVAGYVAGYNRYLRSVGGSKGITDPACHGKPWVHPITTTDAYLRFYQLVLLASQDVVIDGIAQAAPPAGGAIPSNVNTTRTARLLAIRWHKAMGALGSNAVAIGKAGTKDHKHGLLLGNPHFPWVGTERFYEAQLTIPGKVNVSGAMLFGVPIVLIGHNANIAWSHTVSTAFRFTPYQLTLVPGSPTSYLFDGKPTKMTTRTVKVKVRQGAKLVTRTRTLYATRYGPVFTSIEGVPLPWTSAEAFTMRDANADNFRVFNHFLATARATSAHEEFRILKRYQGIPWVNTIVADRTGHALYADIGSIPNVSNALVKRCDTALGAATFKLLGLPILNGTRKSCDWGIDKDAVVPGIFGPRHEPHLFRSDYVTNSNDSYWLSNPAHPLEGYARIIGDERTPRTLRTRIGLIMTKHIVTRGGFTRRRMQNMVFSDRQYAGELTRKALVAMCRGMGGVAPTSAGGVVALGKTCDVLAKWGSHENLSSRGAVLFRRFWAHLDSSPLPVGGPPVSIWAHPFRASDAVHTPYGLRKNLFAKQALGDAVADLDNAGIPLDAPVRSVQGVRRHGHWIPIHGGVGDPNGEFNAIYAAWNGKGFDQVVDGSSFVQVVTWNDGPCPNARTILTYSLSTDPTDPHYADQTRMFSHKRWVRDRFCASAIANAPVHHVLHLRGW
jgi:acyl-homoserine-lactone acylase